MSELALLTSPSYVGTGAEEQKIVPGWGLASLHSALTPLQPRRTGRIQVVEFLVLCQVLE